MGGLLMSCTVEQMLSNLEALYTAVKSPLVTAMVPPVIDKLRVVKAANQIELNDDFQDYYDSMLTPFNRNVAAQDVKQINVVRSVANGYADLSNFNAADVTYNGEKYVSVEVAYQVNKAREVTKENPTDRNKEVLNVLEALKYLGEITPPEDNKVAMVEITNKAALGKIQKIMVSNGALVNALQKDQYEDVSKGLYDILESYGKKNHVATISKVAKSLAKYLESTNDNVDRISLLEDIMTEYYTNNEPSASALWNRRLLLDTGTSDGRVGGFSHNNEMLRDHWVMTFPTLLYKARQTLLDRGAKVTSGEMVESIKLARVNYKVAKAIRPTPVFDSLPSYTVGQRTMTYAGIGSRETPAEVLEEMQKIAEKLESSGYKLQTGYKKRKGSIVEEEGADKAFSSGVKKPANKELFGPDMVNETAMRVAYEVHSNLDNMGNYVYNKWVDKLSKNNEKAVAEAKAREFAEGAKALQARNTFQVFGRNLDTPVDFVLFYAEEKEGDLRPKGGTGQAVEMARRKGIPTINMKNSNWRKELDKVLEMTGKPSSVSTADELEVKDCN